MNILEETKFLMKKYGITANKRLGQNFLVSDEAIYKMISASDLTKEDLIIEIGPGLGTLTKELLENAGKVICIELDGRMVDILKERFCFYSNFEIIQEDVLKVNLRDLILKNKNKDINKVKIVANLPYYITTPIIMKLLEDRLDIESICVMVQKEVANRLVAIPGAEDTGAITYAINYYSKPERIYEVGKEFFIPSPEVNSTIIRLNILKTPNVVVQNEELMFKIIKTAFMQRRKTLLNCLGNSNLFGTKDELEEILISLQIDPQIRAEKLSLYEFAKIADSIYKLKTNY